MAGNVILVCTIVQRGRFVGCIHHLRCREIA